MSAGGENHAARADRRLSQVAGAGRRTLRAPGSAPKELNLARRLPQPDHAATVKSLRKAKCAALGPRECLLGE